MKKGKSKTTASARTSSTDMRRFSRSSQAERQASSRIEEKEIAASRTEIFIKKYIAPELISTPGQISVLVIYAILLVTCIYGISDLKIYYGRDLFVPEGMISYDYNKINNEKFPRIMMV